LIRSVDFPKAVKAGAAGALAMEVAAFALRLAGVHAVDLAAELGSVLVPVDHGTGWSGGLVAHIGVGILWAFFYAYFAWGRLKWPPALQGLAFSAVPAILALLFVYPQLKLMQSGNDIVALRWKDLPTCRSRHS
jgi:hypothetical protein